MNRLLRSPSREVGKAAAAAEDEEPTDAVGEADAPAAAAVVGAVAVDVDVAEDVDAAAATPVALATPAAALAYEVAPTTSRLVIGAAVGLTLPSSSESGTGSPVSQPWVFVCLKKKIKSKTKTEVVNTYFFERFQNK